MALKPRRVRGPEDLGRLYDHKDYFMTLDEVADALERDEGKRLTRQRVQQIEYTALRKLRAMLERSGAAADILEALAPEPDRCDCRIEPPEVDATTEMNWRRTQRRRS